MRIQTKEKICLITGASSGIGKETALVLAKAGFRVAILGRDKEKINTAGKEISEKTGNDRIEGYVCDLSSFDSIKRFVWDFSNRHKYLDVLVNNAGVLTKERQISKDGYEMHFAVNYLAPFLLTNLLLPLLKNGVPARVINVSSTMHTEGHIDFDDIESEKDFDGYRAYGNSKLALILFTKSLAKNLLGTGITVNALHPGWVKTELAFGAFSNKLARLLSSARMITPQKGAATSIYLAVSPEVEKITGKYFVNCREAETSSESKDEKIAGRLWKKSIQIVGLT